MADNLNIESATLLEKRIGPETTLPKDGGILFNSGVSEKCSAYLVSAVDFVLAHNSKYISNSSWHEKNPACSTGLGISRAS